MPPRLGGGIDLGQERAIAQELGRLQDDVALGPTQEVRTTREGRLDHGIRVEAAVPQEQHAGSDRPQQAQAGRLLRAAERSHDHVAQRVGAGLDQRYYAELRKGCGGMPAVGGGPPKQTPARWRVYRPGPAWSHPPPSAASRPGRRLWSWPWRSVPPR